MEKALIIRLVRGSVCCPLLYRTLVCIRAVLKVDLGYLPERKTAVLKRMLLPNNMVIVQLSKEEGNSEATHYGWRTVGRGKGQLLSVLDAFPEGWNPRGKFAGSVETAAMN